MILSINFNYGEHERERIKRYKTVSARLNDAGIAMFKFSTVSYTFEIKQDEIPQTISRLVRRVTEYCPECGQPNCKTCKGVS